MPRGNRTSRHREHAGRRRGQILLGLGLLFLFYLVLSFFLGEMGFFRYIKLRYQREALTAQIASLRESNTELAARVDALKTDPDCIERLAREQGMVKDGETVYQYEGE